MQLVQHHFSTPTHVAVEKVGDRDVFPAAMIAAAEFFLLASAMRRLP
jgi:hypothetical protein